MTTPTIHVITKLRTSTTTEYFTPSSTTTKTLADLRMREEAMDVVVAKIISLLILTVLSVLSGLLPLRLLMYAPHLFTRSRQPTDYFLCGLRLFSGGIYLATCFLHLMPDTRKKIDAVMVNLGSNTTYPVPELLIISGFYAVVFVEQIIKALYVKAQMTDTSRKRKPKSAQKKTKNRQLMSTSTLDDEVFQCGHFKMNADYRDNQNKHYNGGNDDDDDDDDDDNDDDNVLVEDDDDLSYEDDSDSDRRSEGSYTCVKQNLKEMSLACDDATLPRNRIFQGVPGMKSASFSNALMECSNEADNKSKDLEIGITTNQVEDETTAATIPVAVTAMSSAVVFRTPQSSQSDNNFTTLSINPPLGQPVMKHSRNDESSLNSSSQAGFSGHIMNQEKLPRTLNHYHPPLLPPKSYSDHQTQKPLSEINEETKDQPKFVNQLCDETSNAQKHGTRYIHQSCEKPTCNHTPSPYPNISRDSDIATEMAQDCLDQTSLRRLAVSIETERPNCHAARDKDLDSGIFSTKRDCEDYLGETLRLKQMDASDASVDRISERSCSLQDIKVKRVVEELTREDLSKAAHFRSIIYIIALSFHGIFEGMALGLQSMKSSVWALCFAIVVHRCVLAFQLGMDLCRGKEKQGTSFLCIGTFTLISTLGIIVGILISSGALLYSDVTVPEAILQSLATGTIFYIVFLDILFKDLQGRDDLKRVSCFFVGFSVMAIVFAVTQS